MDVRSILLGHILILVWRLAEAKSPGEVCPTSIPNQVMLPQRLPECLSKSGSFGLCDKAGISAFERSSGEPASPS